MLFLCKCPQCGEYDVPEAKFRKMIPPEKKGDFNNCVAEAGPNSVLMLDFTGCCRRCNPGKNYLAVLRFNAGESKPSSKLKPEAVPCC